MNKIRSYSLACVFLLLFTTLALSQNAQFFATLTVYVVPAASSSIFVNCWSNYTSSSSGTCILSQNFSQPGDYSCKIGQNSYDTRIYDIVWCRARMGSNILHRFPIFGQEIGRNSSEWIINSRGRRRLSLENRLTDDLSENWLLT